MVRPISWPKCMDAYNTSMPTILYHVHLDDWKKTRSIESSTNKKVYIQLVAIQHVHGQSNN